MHAYDWQFVGEPCPICGGPVRRRRKRFCSRQCWARSPEAAALLAARNAARRRLPHPCLVCGGPVMRRDGKYCCRACFRASFSPSWKKYGRVGLPADDPPPPTHEQLAQRAAEIRSEWDDAERLTRLRVDWRPAPWTVPLAVAAL